VALQSGADGIERVDAVLVGGDVDHVVDAAAWNRHAGDIERLRVDLVVDRAFEQLAEFAHVDVGRREHRFVEVGASAGGVVMVCGDARLSARRRGRHERAGDERAFQETAKTEFERTTHAAAHEQDARQPRTARWRC
jgi:hypothetical protein